MSGESSKTPQTEPASWIIHGEREVDATRRLRLSIASVQLPDGVRFEQYVMRIPAAAMCLLVDDRDRVLMLRRHRFILDRWVWELPGAGASSLRNAEGSPTGSRRGPRLVTLRQFSAQPGRPGLGRSRPRDCGISRRFRNPRSPRCPRPTPVTATDGPVRSLWFFRIPEEPS